MLLLLPSLARFILSIHAPGKQAGCQILPTVGSLNKKQAGGEIHWYTKQVFPM